MTQTGVSRFLRDANSFVASSREAIERSAPHIYLSALPFAAKDSLVYTTFAPLCTGLITVETLGTDRHGGRLVMILTGHGDWVTSVAYSPDGSVIASGSHDGTVRIWDVRTGEEMVSPLRSGDGPIYSVAYSPNGQHLASGTKAGIVCIWNPLAKHESPHRLSGHSQRVNSVSFSPNSSVLASASFDSTVRLWSLNTRQQLLVLDSTVRVQAVTFSPDGKTMAFAGDEDMITLRRSSGELVELTLGLDDSFISSLAFSPDSMRLASACSDGLIRVWDINSDTVTEFIQNTVPKSVQFSSDGQSLVSAGEDGTVRHWTVRDSMEIYTFLRSDGHTGLVNSVTFSPDSLYIASASEDRSIRIWDVRSDHPVVQPLAPAHHSTIDSVAVSLDGTFIVSGSGDHSVCVWNMPTCDLRFAPLLGHVDRVHSVAISPDGLIIASASLDETIKLWDAHTAEVVGDLLQQGANNLVFSPDAQWLAWGLDDCTIHIWDTKLRQLSTLGPLFCDSDVGAVAFSPNGQILAALDREYIYLWDINTGQYVTEPLRVCNASQYQRGIGFSVDGTRIVSCQGDDTTARVWNVNTGQLVFILKGETRGIDSVSFSYDGRFIGSASGDATVRLWDAESGRQIVTLYGHAHTVSSFAFTPDGRSIVSCSVDETIRIWDIEAARSALPAKTKDLVAMLTSTGLEDGWLLGPKGELLLWIPPDYRAHLCLPHSIFISKRRISIDADAEALHAGKDWTSCWLGNDPTPLSGTV